MRIITLITALILLSTTKAEARVKRGEFTSNGYIMHHERNDYKGAGKGYRPYRYDQ